MDKRIALVLGGLGGIGLESAKSLAAMGIEVCIGHRKNLEEAKLILEKERFQSKETYKIDVRDKDNVQEAINRLLETHKKVDIVVYTISLPLFHKRILDMEWEDYQNHIDIQIKGFFSVVKSLSNLIKSNHKIKFIIVLTEYCIGKPPSMLSHYITAKYGLMGLTKTLASELQDTNCTFNMISPGITDTKLLSSIPPKFLEIAAYKNPMKRIAKPKDIAEIISFLASEKSDYLNGVNLLVDGGNTFS
jgi:3-oxoacyl-[acyl-carrier protein] reductase